MDPFKYVRANDVDAALAAAREPRTVFLAGGTTLVDLMRLRVMTPLTVVDVSHLPLAEVRETPEGVLIGAMARNSDVADHPLVKERFPALSQALVAGASPQLRNMATVGGNLLQRTRCTYFRDHDNAACNKRVPGSGCRAMDGWTRMHAVLGVSDHCIAAHPSDMCVALAALDAVVHVTGPRGPRAIPIGDFHALPGDTPHVENALAAGELVTHVMVPATPFAARSTYVKARDRASFAFALASCAVALDMNGNVMRDARVALGGVGTKPWRSLDAEKALAGKAPSRQTFRTAAETALKDAHPTKDNAFKVELAKRVIVRALTLTTRLA